MNKLINSLGNQSRSAKLRMALEVDFILSICAVWFTFVLKLDVWDGAIELYPLAYVLVAPSLLVTGYCLGLYRTVTRHISAQFYWLLCKVVIMTTLVWATGIELSGEEVPRSTIIIFALVLYVALCAPRVFVRLMLGGPIIGNGSTSRAIVYGADEVGRRLLDSMPANPGVKVAAFVDKRDSGFIGLEVGGARVHNVKRLSGLLKTFDAKLLLLARDDLSRTEKKELVRLCSEAGAKVMVAPNYLDLLSGRSRDGKYRPVSVEDLLGRDVVPPSGKLLEACIKGKVVLVTGAGGSIGSELCRQIFTLRPTRMVLYEHSELALYTIDQELRRYVKDVLGQSTEIISVLGSVTEPIRLARVFEHYAPHAVYHAAAYKHVPLVETNIAEGTYNNVCGTCNVAELSFKHSIENLVVISTDKAVRPKNVMGASKRFSEIVVQALAERYSKGVTRAVMVRFGNVLGSSGSVLPLFERQIAAGGPVTVTHPDVTRYFMTITEAAQLVIQAGAMGSGGEVYLLDMGEPMRIVDLARDMIGLEGLSVKDDENPLGDIEIEFTGLRPGEKLSEELLIGSDVQGTEHGMIMKAKETFLNWDELELLLPELETLIEKMDGAGVRAFLLAHVEGYESTDETMYDVLQ